MTTTHRKNVSCLTPIYTVAVCVSAVLQLVIDKALWLLRHIHAPKHFILQSLCCLLKI